MATQSKKKPTRSAKPGSPKDMLEPKRVTNKVNKAVRKASTRKGMSKAQRSIALGAVAAIALVGALRMPVIRTVALPFLATAATKNWKTIIRTLQKSR